MRDVTEAADGVGGQKKSSTVDAFKIQLLHYVSRQSMVGFNMVKDG